MDLTAEQFDLLLLRRSQEDLNLMIEALENDGSINAPADSPALMRSKEIQERERELDKRQGGKGETHWEKRKAAFEAEAEERKKAEEEREKEEAERAGAEGDERESRRLADKEAEKKAAARS